MKKSSPKQMAESLRRILSDPSYHNLRRELKIQFSECTENDDPDNPCINCPLHEISNDQVCFVWKYIFTYCEDEDIDVARYELLLKKYRSRLGMFLLDCRIYLERWDAAKAESRESDV